MGVLILLCLLYVILVYKLTLFVCNWRWSCIFLHWSRWYYRWYWRCIEIEGGLA